MGFESNAAALQLRSAKPRFLLVQARRDQVREVVATVPQPYQAWKASPRLRPIRRI